MIKIKGRQNSKISSLFRSSWNTHNGPGKREEDFQKLIHNSSFSVKNCNSSAEGLCAILSMFISHYLRKVDYFENNFRNVLWDFIIIIT